MAVRLITTFTKQNDADPWILLAKAYVPQVFSEQEIAEVVLPFIEYSKSLPGMIPDSFTLDVAGNVATMARDFDTEQAAAIYQHTLGPGSANPLVIAKNQLLKSKFEALNVPLYTIQSSLHTITSN